MKAAWKAYLLAMMLCGAAAPLSVAESAKPAAAPAESDTRIVETTSYNAWSVTCEGKKAGAPNWRCQANFTMKDQKTGAVLLVWFLSVNKDGKIAAEIVTLTGIQVDKGVVLTYGPQPKPKKIAYSWCDTNQCSAQTLLDDQSLKDLAGAAGAEATLTTILKDGRALNFQFPLAGVDKVVARLKG